MKDVGNEHLAKPLSDGGFRLEELPGRLPSEYNSGMKTATRSPSTEGAIWARIVDPATGDLTRETAETFLQFDFNPGDRRRMDELAEKAQAGTLTAQDRYDAETYNRVAHLLALLQSKARQSLKAGKKR